MTGYGWIAVSITSFHRLDPPPKVRAMRLRAAVASGLALVLLGGLAACSDDGGDSAAKERPTYDLAPRRARPDEVALHGRRGRSSDMEFTVIGFRTGMPELVGSHADARPKGRFTRIRVIAENRGRDTQYFTTNKQLLVTTDGLTHKPSPDAMIIKRQPAEELPIGSAIRVELDVWWDIPATSKVRAVRLVGSPAVGAISDPAPAEIPLP